MDSQPISCKRVTDMLQHVSSNTRRTSSVSVVVLALGCFPAQACNAKDGCVHSFQLENYRMVHDGRNSEALRLGKENVEAFNRLARARAARTGMIRASGAWLSSILQR